MICRTSHPSTSTWRRPGGGWPSKNDTRNGSMATNHRQGPSEPLQNEQPPLGVLKDSKMFPYVRDAMLNFSRVKYRNINRPIHVIVSFFSLSHGWMESQRVGSTKYFDELLGELSELNKLRAHDPSSFAQASMLLSQEIKRVWQQLNNQPAGDSMVVQPDRAREPTTLQEKILIPKVVDGKDSNGRKFNPIGRILGPSGLSVKQLEAETECQILIRGNGSVKDAFRQSRLRGSPGWEHLDEPLHVVVSATDKSRRRAEEKLKKGTEKVRKLLQPSHDEYKKKQLMQLAIINGTYRHSRRD